MFQVWLKAKVRSGETGPNLSIFQNFPMYLHYRSCIKLIATFISRHTCLGLPIDILISKGSNVSLEKCYNYWTRLTLKSASAGVMSIIGHRMSSPLCLCSSRRSVIHLITQVRQAVRYSKNVATNFIQEKLLNLYKSVHNGDTTSLRRISLSQNLLKNKTALGKEIHNSIRYAKCILTIFPEHFFFRIFPRKSRPG